MSLVKDILRITAYHYPLGNKGLYEYLYGKKGKPNRNSFYVTLSRLKSQGLVKKVGETWLITPEGKEMLQTPDKKAIRNFFPLRKVNGAVRRKLIVVFDIPEKRRNYRDWLRSELIGFGFDLIQRSVWFGPPLPQEFLEYLEDQKLLKYIRFFKAEESDLI
jgi:phenylacetic acid degradation operon negative regulatory protein